MTTPACHDPATTAIHAVLAAMRSAFSPNGVCRPLGGGSEKVWFFAGEGAPLDEVNCDSPFLWVRLASRYRSDVFPDPAVLMNPCGSQEVIVVEVGVARCAITTDSTIDRYTDEARIGMDDSWRLNKVACLVSAELSDSQIGGDTVIPYGPEGGIVAWSTTLFISI